MHYALSCDELSNLDASLKTARLGVRGRHAYVLVRARGQLVVKGVGFGTKLGRGMVAVHGGVTIPLGDGWSAHFGLRGVWGGYRPNVIVPLLAASDINAACPVVHDGQLSGCPIPCHSKCDRSVLLHGQNY